MLDGDTRAERDSLRRGAEADAKMRGIIEQQRRTISEQRMMLEKSCAAEQAEAKRYNQDAADLRVEIAREAPDEENHNLKEHQVAIDGAEAAIWDAEAKLAECHREARELENTERLQFETSKRIYKLMLGMTGVRWDTEASTCKGYVALNRAKHFEVPAEVSSSSPTEAADRIWEDIEKSLSTSAPLPKVGGA
jgi:hypothetical protein